MNNFLETVKTSLNNLSSFKEVQIVLGNESCDLDSVVSTLCYAFFLNSFVKERKITIPVLNVSEDDFPLKTESNYFLADNNINMTNLIFRNQIDLRKLCSNDQLKLYLVDHHVISLDLVRCVAGIVDHRPIDLSVNWPRPLYDIQLVGSCSTLISKIILDNKPDIVDETIARLLHGTIILDTVNFNVEANKFQALDTEIVQSLEQKFTKTCSNEELFKKLLNARNDVSSLTPLQILKKDLKIARCLPVAGLPMLVEDFVKIPNAESALKEFCRELNVKVVVLMGLTVKGSVYRDIAIYATENCKLKARILHYLLAFNTLRLTLKSHGTLSHFSQDNVKLSRKHIIPVIVQACDE